MNLLLTFLFFIIPSISYSQTNEIKEVSNVNHASFIMYHRFGDSRYPSTNIKKEQFIEHINELLKPKYNIIGIEKAILAINNIELVKDRSVVITIDDAYSSVYEYAWPIFKKYNLPFTLFISTDVIDNKTPGYMNWEQIRNLRDNGVTIGSQTKSHPHMFKLTTEKIIEELSISNKRFIDEIGSKPKFFAYPYGEYNLEVIEQVKLHGFIAAFGQHSGVAHKSLGMYELPRFAMNEKYGDMERFLLAANALPMPISDVSPKNPVISINPPSYGFTLSDIIEPKNVIRCFANNGLKANTKRLGKNRIEIRLSGPFSKGRGRINCTMAGNDNRWRWLGRQFIVN
tara:strand:+ start:63 stop:1088 length:1026 start_codon:yes stop_codon:yes gene_type:complete